MVARAARTLALRPLVLAAWALALAGCGGGEPLAVHSSLPEAVTDAAEDVFEDAHPGVDVRVVTEPPDQTLERLRSGMPEAVDVWWGAPPHVLEVAAQEGLLAPHRPSWSVDPGLADLENRWHASFVSPFVIAFNRDSLSVGLAPRDWRDLFHFRFRGEVVLPDPAESDETDYFLVYMLVERLRAGRNLVEAFDWLLRLDASVGAYEPEVADVVRRLRFGEARVAVLPRHAAEGARHGDAPWLHYRFAESGAPVLVRGIAVTAASRRPDLARAFVDVTGSEAVAGAARLETRWAPVGRTADAVPLPNDFELDLSWTPVPLAADTLAAALDGWMRRWEAEVRGRGAALF